MRLGAEGADGHGRSGEAANDGFDGFDVVQRHWIAVGDETQEVPDGVGVAVVDHAVVGGEVVGIAGPQGSLHGLDEAWVGGVELAVTPIARPADVSRRRRSFRLKRFRMARQHIRREFLEADAADA